MLGNNWLTGIKARKKKWTNGKKKTQLPSVTSIEQNQHKMN